jgi:phage antirepressor YoqD-like protein
MGIGRNRLFAFLRYKGVLMPNNQAYQEYIDRGYFRTIEQKYSRPDGSVHISIKTLVYQRGLDFIRKLYANEKGSFALADAN